MVTEEESYLNVVAEHWNSVSPDSIECFIEDQAFSRSYDLAPRPPPPLRVSLTGDKDTERLRKRVNLRTGEGRKQGVGEEPNHTTTRKPGLLNSKS